MPRLKVKEAADNLEQVESLVHDLYWGRTDMVTKERVSMACGLVSEAIEILIALKTTEKAETKGYPKVLI